MYVATFWIESSTKSPVILTCRSSIKLIKEELAKHFGSEFIQKTLTTPTKRMTANLKDQGGVFIEHQIDIYNIGKVDVNSIYDQYGYYSFCNSFSDYNMHKKGISIFGPYNSIDNIQFDHIIMLSHSHNEV